ncbi:MAG: transcription termination/antitermination protein NusA [Sphingomonadales bacterium RIFCSPHIGHO2_01_FULL_65_20]|jgi:N utilization substance protein A|uniref:Transcription termination/antitermination protein NusA n=1 Tax=Sphingomonas ursincola TaxID=56361 RepID=A0A7V8RDX1_9SPHN|nr:transcription termination factor NusA [Sphingomonas ursincola]MBA4780569.1 transcription termination/antitermination protein NusA [Blastomonas sp.]OHC97167.1 MAG: transcription termination/antitermination protein NusA [Sphingomonadales bacterium RIFCSPHIGHO2_01_FULL_65_20]MBA1374475.1 transcription termination/antitermination protein NusA [Sphingomonas ursincola]MBY0619741.1 transcription termination factor NusA [Sphingomonas ursincola]MCH2237739.1 transcription termination factor NusA [Bla
MASAISANKAELLAIANSVATEKMIDKAIVLEAMEEAIQRAARARYGAENDIRAKLDPVSGDLRLWRVVEVVETVEDYFKQVDVKQAQKLQKGAQVGDFIVDPLPPVDLGRIDAQAAKQVIFQKVRDAERERQYDEFKDRVGEIITGVVKSVEFGHVIVNLGRAEGVIRREQQIPREVARVGDRIRAIILNVRRENRGPQIFLSRAHPDFMRKLFELEVPEIYDGIIQIKAAARDPGSRAKIGVISYDSSIDPVGACVGMKGSRVQAVVQEMQGEKIDIIPWSEDTATFVVNALQPATVSRVVIDEEESRIEVVVPDDQLSLAIGRRGQNVRLASQLTGSAIDIMTEAESSEKRQKEFTERSEMFQNELDVDETLSQLLVAEGFSELEEVAYVSPEELSSIEGFDEELAEELQSRAQEALERREEASREERRGLGVDDALAELPHLTEAMLVTLGKAGIKTLDDLADLATDELIAKKRTEQRRRDNSAPANKRPEDKGGVLATYGLTEEQGNEIIMAARAHWFEDEDAGADGEDAHAETSQ